MSSEIPGPSPEEVQGSVESEDRRAEVVQGLRDRIDDPVELRNFSKENDVVSGKWGSGATEALEAFHEKYSRWLGQEEEDRQIKEYLGNGQGSKWQEKTLEAYKTMFPDTPLEQDRWTQAARLVKRELKDARLEEYRRHEALPDEDNKSVGPVETSPKVEILGSTRVDVETRAREDRPNNNQDAVLVNNEKQLYAVFDGMGGMHGGEQASNEAARILHETFKIDHTSIKEVESDLVKVLEIADQALAKDRVGHTTATVAKIWEQNGSRFLVWAHIGDSRLFLLRGGQDIQQVTTDDSEISSAVSDGEITPKQAEIIDQATRETQMNEKMRKIFGERHLTQGLGGGKAVIKTGSFQLKPGDRVVLTSDGIHDNLTKLDMESSLGWTHPARDLIEAAFRYSQQRNFRSKRDDMSAVVIDIPPFKDPFADFPEK